MRELSVHKRRIYRRLSPDTNCPLELFVPGEGPGRWPGAACKAGTGGLCCHLPSAICHLPSATCHLPSPTASLGLDYAVCSPSPRTSALRLPPDKPSRGCPCRRPVVILLTMSPSRYSHRGLPPHKFAPMLGAHHSLNLTLCGGPILFSISFQPKIDPPQSPGYLKR